MTERGSGHIITISSDAGRRVFPNLSVYCASKYFVEALSEGTRRELVVSAASCTAAVWVSAPWRLPHHYHLGAFL